VSISNRRLTGEPVMCIRTPVFQAVDGILPIIGPELLRAGVFANRLALLRRQGARRLANPFCIQKEAQLKIDTNGH
jgi:hypothetical protein